MSTIPTLFSLSSNITAKMLVENVQSKNKVPKLSEIVLHKTVSLYAAPFATNMIREVKEHLHIFRKIFEKENPEISDFNNALSAAISYRNINAVKILLSKGADIYTTNMSSDSIWVVAIKAGCRDILELFLDKGVDINNIDRYGYTPLMHAVCSGYKDVLELLLDRGADINAKNNTGNTALHLASKQGNKKVVEFLLSRGAVISSRTLLLLATESLDRDVMELLKRDLKIECL